MCDDAQNYVTVHSDDSSKKVVTIPLVPSTRAVRFHSGAIVAPRKFHVVYNAPQVCGNPEYRVECGALFCDILRLPLLPHAHSIGDSIQRGRKDLNCVVLHVGSSCTEAVLNGIPASPERFNPSCNRAIWKRCIVTCLTEPLKTLLCTTNSCHFNFDLGTLL